MATMKFAILSALVLVGVRALSEPYCDCEAPEMVCESLSRPGCETVRDYCDCCDVCAARDGEPCQYFGVRCGRGLHCVYTEFWNDEVPISGTCRVKG